MAKIIKTPGVYIQEIPSFPPSVAQVETSIPVFIGYTEKAVDNNGAPLPSALIDGITITQGKRITSLLEYENYFGKTVPKVTIQINETGILTKSAALNPNITVTAPSAPSFYNHLQLYFANGGGPCYIVSAGAATLPVSAAALLAGLKMAGRNDEPSIVVIPQATQLPTAADYGQVYSAALQQSTDLQDRFVILDCYNDDPAILRSNTGNIHLQYGAAYHPFLQISYSNIFDPNNASITITPINMMVGRKQPAITTTYTALSADIRALVDAALAKQNIITPPCSAIAGVYARVDNSRGVWKSPANESLNLVTGLTQTINDAEQDGLNVDAATGKSINAIRAFAGKGILVWGARTLAGNDNEWRYVSVRRMVTMVEESTKKATESFLFEPNNANTWAKIQAMLENYLTQLWRAGALQGIKPEQSFYVAVGLNKTMTSVDILEGRLNIEIGMAPTRPAEFVIIRFTQIMSES